MIINVWGTQRTGSVWYMHYLASQYNNDNILMAAPFEDFQNSTYKIKDETGRGIYIYEYRTNAFYNEYYLDENQYLRKRKIYNRRTRSPIEEELRYLDIFRNVNSDQLVIINHHVPLHRDYMPEMMALASRNIWIDRKNKKQQLASWVVSWSCKTFTYYDTVSVYNGEVHDCDRSVLEKLLHRIQWWDNYSNKSETISFEDLPFSNKPGFPVDGNLNSWNRLSDNMKNTINELVEEYENGKKSNI